MPSAPLIFTPRLPQVRIILNKADQLPADRLLSVQGSLIWSLSPLIGSTTPPPIYSGSFVQAPYREGAPAELFRSQEDAILTDIARSLSSRVENRIGLARRHAVSAASPGSYGWDWHSGVLYTCIVFCKNSTLDIEFAHFCTFGEDVIF